MGGARTALAVLACATTAFGLPAAAGAQLPARTTVPLGSALWYACADAAYAGPPALACPVQPFAPAYATTYTANFDRLTPENEFKMQFTQPNMGQYDFTLASQVAEFARARGKRVRGHALIYAAQNPGWVDNPPALGQWTRTTLLATMRDHIDTLVRHFRTNYANVVDQYDVVNEPFLDSGERDPNVYQRLIGNDWIEQAFLAARVADPFALLFLNEFNADVAGPRHEALLALARDFVRRSVPLDGIGLEMHIGANGSYPTVAELKAVMSEYLALGLRVELTELDVLRPVVWDGGTAQRAAYNVAAEACREMPNCTGVTVWGVADRYSWRSADQRATLFDSSFAAKPSYADVRCRLNDPMPEFGPWTPVDCGPLVPVTGVPKTIGPTTGSSIASNQPPPPPPPPTAEPPPPRDTTAPRTAIAVKAAQRLGPTIAVRVTCIDEPCRVTVIASAGVPNPRTGRKRTYRPRSMTGLVHQGRSFRGKVRLTVATRAAMTRALRAKRGVTVTLRIAVADSAGNSRVVTRRVKLRL